MEQSQGAHAANEVPPDLLVGKPRVHFFVAHNLLIQVTFLRKVKHHAEVLARVNKAFLVAYDVGMLDTSQHPHFIQGILLFPI